MSGGGRVSEPQPQSSGRSERTGGYWGDGQSRQPLGGEIPTRHGQPLRVEQSSGGGRSGGPACQSEGNRPRTGRRVQSTKRTSNHHQQSQRRPVRKRSGQKEWS